MSESKSSPVDISVERAGAAATIAVSGEVDLESSAILNDALNAVRDCSEVHLDLTNVEYMDSTGLRVVLVARDQFAEGGGLLDVVAASSIVTRLIEITGIDGLLT